MEEGVRVLYRRDQVDNQVVLATSTNPVPRAGECCCDGAAKVGGSGCLAEDVCVREGDIHVEVRPSLAIYVIFHVLTLRRRLCTKDRVERLPHTQGLRSGMPPCFLLFHPLYITLTPR